MRIKAEECPECGYKTTDHEKMIRHKEKYCTALRVHERKQSYLDSFDEVEK